MNDVFDSLKELDREGLMIRMADELPEIRNRLNVTLKELAEKTGVDESRLRAIEAGKRKLKWSEYMSILFVIWNNDIGRGILDSKELFPDELKKAMSINRNAHAPMTKGKSF